MRVGNILKTLLVAFMGLVVLAQTAILRVTAQTGDSTAGPGTHLLILKRGEKLPIYYAVSIPKNYAATMPVPLILALHFGVGGGTGNGAGRDLLRAMVGPAFEDLHAIIIAPDSLGGDWSTPENEEAVRALLDETETTYSIDKSKVAITGYSMGGAGAWHLAEKWPERFSAVVPVAGRPPASAAGWKVPVFAVHSRADQVVPFAPTETRIAELQKVGVNAKLVALTDISHYQTTRFSAPLHQAVPWLQAIWLRAAAPPATSK